jgi:glycerophosphoryl diester phosphodiesterase
MNLGRNSKCWGKDHDDTKGGTWQVGSNDVSYHALADRAPPSQDFLDKTVVYSIPVGHLESGGNGNTLDPFPTYVFDDVTPLACHSHNDYGGNDRIALYSALSAGCVSVEADIWIKGGDHLIVNHIAPAAGSGQGTLKDLYLDPLKKLIDDRKAVFSKAPAQSLGLLIDFKDDDKDKSFDMLVMALAPLRDAGYLSTVENGKFNKGHVTVIASGNRPIDKILDPTANPLRAIFADAFIDGDLGPYNAENAYYASAEFPNVSPNSKLPLPAKAQAQLEEAHKKGLKVRYYEIPTDTNTWQQLVDAGVDRVNVDDLTDIAAVKWNADLL